MTSDIAPLLPAFLTALVSVVAIIVSAASAYWVAKFNSKNAHDLKIKEQKILFLNRNIEEIHVFIAKIDKEANEILKNDSEEFHESLFRAGLHTSMHYASFFENKKYLIPDIHVKKISKIIFCFDKYIKRGNNEGKTNNNMKRLFRLNSIANKIIHTQVNIYHGNLKKIFYL